MAVLHFDEKLKLKNELMNALEKNEFQLYYQPKLDFETGEIKEVEALVRWDHPEKGIISPLEFIPLAEETGLIIMIGERVLRMACEQSRVWQEAGLAPMIMAVNLSACQFYQPNLVEKIQTILKETGLSPKHLELEITESMVMNVHHVLPILQELKRIGVQISLDDFGTGCSSLFCLKKLPIDKIKIDQCFVRSCTVDANDATIVKTIITMAHKLNMKVIAEGVESKDHLIFLQQNLCNMGQGFLFSPPLPPNELIQQFSKIEQIIIRKGIPQRLSKQKWLEEKLKCARQALQDMVRRQQGMTFKFINKNGKFIHTLCDGELLYRMGFTSELIVGKELFDFLPYSDAVNKLSYYQRAWDGEEHVTYEREDKGIWYFTSLRPIRKGGQVVEVIGSSVDITERKRVEESLKKSEAKYRIITENVRDLIRVLNTNFIVEYSSTSHVMVLGYSPRVLEGKFIFELIHPDDIVHVKSQYTQVISTKTPCKLEFRHKHATGGWILVEAQANPVFGRNSEIEQIVVVARDISERKKSEELMRKSALGKLAAGVAYEIRNPLTTIKGFSQLMKKQGESPFYIDMILSEVRRLEDIVGEFLTFANSKAYQMKETDFTLLLQQVVVLLNPHITLENIRIIEEVDSDLSFVYCDESQMKQVFIHILQNAFDAMPNGGIIKIQLFSHGFKHIKVRFIDQGNGIRKDRMRTTGEPFYSTKENGTGLGLFISQKIVQEHGGTIDIISTPGQGTTVDVTLPIKQSFCVESKI